MRVTNILCGWEIYFYEFQISNFKFEMKFAFSQIIQNYELQIL